MTALAEPVIRAAFLSACRAELDALKPGNVHVHRAGHGMVVEDFETAAEAAGPWIAAPGLGVGARINQAVAAAMAAAGCNTNLGILLLCVPLAAAALLDLPAMLKQRTARVLAGLDVDDAREVFTAIRRANPGGLGTTDAQDVASAPTIPLLDAMRLAADRDRIARAYVTGFAEVFEFGLPALTAARRATKTEPHAITHLHMAFLAAAPDSHIARKSGMPVAEQVRRQAEALTHHIAKAEPMAATADLHAFDRELKERRLNPGTTADFVVATLFAAALEAKLVDFTAV